MEALTGENLKTFQDECKKNTQIITSRQIFNASLKDLCKNTIINSLRMSSKVTIDLQRLVDLPFALRQELLKKLSHVVDVVQENKEDIITLEVRFTFVSLLIEQLSEFNFKCLRRSSEEDELTGKSKSEDQTVYLLVPQPYEQQMFALLAQKCRKHLQRLIYFNESHATYLACTDFVYPALLGSLIQLSNLQHLELTRYAFRKSEFALLGSKLVNLVYLNCNVVDATPLSLSEGLKPMKKLQVFIFSVAITDNKKKIKLINGASLYQTCIKEFPSLKVAGENLNGKFEWGPFFHFEGKNQTFGVDDDTLYGPRCRSQLEHLILGEPISQGQLEWHSNVTSLYVDLYRFENETQKIEDLWKLRNVKRLIMNGPISDHANAEALITRFLQVFGTKLTCLCIYATSQEIRYRVIASLCPNLTTLSMDRNTPIFGGELDELQPFKALTKIYFSHFNISQNPEVLVQLFTAPKLEDLQMVAITFGAASSAKALMDLRVKEEAIAPRLRCLKVLLSTVEETEQFTRPQIPEYYHEYFLLLHFVCSKAPLLKEMFLLPLGFPLECADFMKPMFKRLRFH